MLRAWPAHDAPGAGALLSLLTEATEVHSSCGCGCASIGVVGSDEGPDLGVSIFEVDADGHHT